MEAIRAQSLSKNYQISLKSYGLKTSLRHFISRKNETFEAVKDLSFSIKKGEIVGFIGPNGAGKTTTLKMLCGLIYPSSGNLEVLGFAPFARQYHFLKEITLVMGMKQQLIWDLPPIDTFSVNASIYGLSKFEEKQRISELSEMLQLGNEIYRPVRKLSLGERMKCELLASLLHRPSVLFLDEPTLGLDINSQARVREFLIGYNKRYGSTIILTSHYMEDITFLCERVIIIDKGKKCFDGDLSLLADSLSTEKFIILDFYDLYNIKEFEKYGEIYECSDYTLKIIIKKDKFLEVIPEILKIHNIRDMQVKSKPIEKIIGEFFNSNG